MSRRFLSLAILPAALILASSGGGGDGKQATCFSEGFVDIVGINKVKKMGSPE